MALKRKTNEVKLGNATEKQFHMMMKMCICRHVNPTSRQIIYRWVDRLLVERKGIWRCMPIDREETEGGGLGDFTHPSGREERAGGVTRTIQKVVCVQLQTHPPRIGQTETKVTQTSRQKPPGQRNTRTIRQRRGARKGQNAVQRGQIVEPVKKFAGAKIKGGGKR